MLPFRLVYHEEYYLPIGAHVFPAAKYRLIHEQLLRSGIAQAGDFVAPQPAADADVLLVHTDEYVHKLKTGSLSRQEELQMEIPFSLELTKTFWLSAGGSILATKLALQDQMCCNLAGGFHHAHPGHGEGFCMIHDVAIAIRRAQRDKLIDRAMTIDCDVHHGNGTAAIFPPGNSEVFTVSLHQEDNYPVHKPPSDIDVGLPDGLGDDAYLGLLEETLDSAFRRFTPDLVCYIAGADPYREDQLGGLALSQEGLSKRDALVFEASIARGIPVMITFAGGYARHVEDTVAIHCNTILTAAKCMKACAGERSA